MSTTGSSKRNCAATPFRSVFHDRAAKSDVDLIVLSAGDSPLAPEVRRGIELQRGVRLHVHRLTGRAEASDANRWETIARARNAGRRLGRSPWVMFLDDDVVLGPETTARLLDGLKARPAYGALAADYLGESRQGAISPHVAMGATLFRRVALQQVRFRWERDRCECQCCCDDLRRQGIGIRYLPDAVARHVKGRSACPSRETTAGLSIESPAGKAEPGRILVAFDRRHYGKFRRQFLGSLRASGNRETVTAVAYGLYPSEQGALRATQGVELVARPDARTMVPVRRLRDFQDVVGRWSADTPVAYWDAADVIFQDRLDDLATPGELVHSTRIKDSFTEVVTRNTRRNHAVLDRFPASFHAENAQPHVGKEFGGMPFAASQIKDGCDVKAVNQKTPHVRIVTSRIRLALDVSSQVTLVVEFEVLAHGTEILFTREGNRSLCPPTKCTMCFSSDASRNCGASQFSSWGSHTSSSRF